MTRRLSACIAALFLSFFATPSWSGTIVDPTGDTFGSLAVQHDITEVRTTFQASSVLFEVDFASGILAPSALDLASVAGFLEIDRDENPGTGAVSNISLFGNAPSGLGVELSLDLFSEIFSPGFLEVVETGGLTVVGTVPISFRPSGFSIDLPFSLLNYPDQSFRFGLIMGTFNESTDQISPISARNDVVPEWQTAKRLRHKSKVEPSQRCSAKPLPSRMPREWRDVDSSERAIYRGCGKAVVFRWEARCLRRNAAAWLRKAFVLDVPRDILGHRSPANKEIYPEVDQQKTIDVMAQIA